MVPPGCFYMYAEWPCDNDRCSIIFICTPWQLTVGIKMRQWSADNPKASLMERKRALIVAAAQQAFLDKGYAESSMGRIADAAGVSIKTVYRHFENKDDL